MANTHDIGESESSEDDSISLASTVASTHAEDVVYEIETIVAEETIDRVTWYLIKWKGYSEDHNTWEPKEQFNSDEIFKEWMERQMHISRGREKPFDVKAWLERQVQLEQDAEKRKRRRQRKRRRLNLDPDARPSNSKDDDQGSPDKEVNSFLHQYSSSSASGGSPPTAQAAQGPIAPWTNEEKRMLEKGLKEARRPKFNEILGWYGDWGTINRVLKGKTPRDLRQKTEELRQEFVSAGREPPDYYLDALPQPLRRAKARDSSRHNDRISGEETSSDSERKVDSLLEEIKEKASKKRSTSKPKATPKKMTMTPALPKEARKETSPPKKPDVTNKELGASISRPGSVNKSKAPPKNPTTEARIDRHEKPTRDPVRIDMSDRGATETAKPANLPAQGQRAPNTARMGAIGSGPARLASAKTVTNPAEKTRKPSVGGTDAGISWKAEPKRRKTLPTTNTEEPRTRFTKLSIQNTVMKSRRNEPAPNRDNLIFLDPKTGKTPKPVSKPSAVVERTKTPFQEFQEKLGAEKAKDWRIKESQGERTDGDAMLVDKNRQNRDSHGPGIDSDAILVDNNRQTRKSQKTGVEKLAAEKAKDRQTKDSQGAVIDGDAILMDEPEEPDASIKGPKSSEADKSSRASQNMEPKLGPSPPSSVTVKFGQPPTAHMFSDPAPELPVDAPTAPKKSRERSAKSPLPGYVERSTLSTSSTTANSNPSLTPYDTAFALMNNPSIEQRHKLASLWDQNCIIGDLRLGAVGSLGVEKINVKFLGLNFEMHRLLLTIKIETRTMYFDFTKSCRASECQNYFLTDPSEYLGSGFIVPYSNTEYTTERLAENLAMTLSCGLFFAQNFTMIMYPAGASAWGFLDRNLPAVPEGTFLRFIIRQPLSERLAGENLIIDRLASQNPDRLAEIMTHVRDNLIQPDEKNINVVFRDLFEIEYGRLVAQNGQQRCSAAEDLSQKGLLTPKPAADIFFLCFIPQGCELYEPDSAKRMALRTRTSEEHDYFIEYLEANGAKEIYSMQDKGSIDVQNNGAWDYFINNVKAGQVIFHDACIRIDQIPNLAKFLRQGAINVWKTSLSPMHPAEKHPHLVRLFPHGGVILLTESLILYRPYEALRILMWFRRIQLPMKPSGTWKIATRPRIREWLLDLMDVCDDTKRDMFSHGIQIIADIYTEILWLFETPDPEDNGLMCYDYDYEIPTDNAPIVTSASLRALQERKEWKGDSLESTKMDHDNIRQNDDLLVQWFAEWAVVNLESFRKFHAVLGYPKGDEFGDKALKAYERGWGHIEVLTAEECFKRHSVTSQEELDKVEAERRRKVREQIPIKREEARKAQIKERRAAKEALEIHLQVFRDAGAMEGEVTAAGRQYLRASGATDKEIDDCAIDMERVLVPNHWDEPYEGPKTNKDDGDIPMNDPDMGGKGGGEAISRPSSAMDTASESGVGGKKRRTEPSRHRRTQSRSGARMNAGATSANQGKGAKG